MKHFNHKKAVQALNLLAIWSEGKCNKMKALKLIWLSDRFHLRKYGRPILFDHYIAMENGPVASKTRDILERNSIGVSQDILEYSAGYINSDRYDYKSIQEVNNRVFSESDLEAMRAVFAKYGKLDKYALRDITHEFPEWKKWEEGLKKKEFKLHPMDYHDFFLDAGEKHHFFNETPEEIELAHRVFSRK